jgi:hypothetical protein
VDKKFTAVGDVALVEEDGDQVWMISGGRDDVKFRVDNLDDSILMVLRMVDREGLDFEGGITYTQMEEWADRRDNQISGTVTIDWVKYGDLVFSVL